MASKDNDVKQNGKPRILILGGLGHIGRTFLKYLVQENLASYIRLSDKAIPITAYCSKEIEACIKLDYVEFTQADLTKDMHLEKVFQLGPNGEGFDYVINAAAETRNGLSEDIYNNRILELSVKCAEKCLIMNEKCSSNELKKWIELSSCQVYTSQNRRPAKEDNNKKPWTIHAKYKLLAEEALQNIARDKNNKLPLIILRVANVYGKGDVRGIMPRIVTAAAYQVLGEPMNFLWGADLKINTVHVDDVINAIW
jgi:nucleoside-diphosphate-sugar epimerase